MEPLFVVTTVYYNPKLSQPTIHAYGPYDQNQASYERTNIMRDNADLVRDGLLIVKTNKILDPEGKTKFIWAKA